MGSGMSGRIAGRVAVVTGGASGIGAGIARRFCQEGARVLLADIDETLGSAVASSCGAAFVHLDVSDPKAWSNLEHMLRSEYGRLDVMVNNAGVVSALDIMQVTLEDWNRLMGINLTGMMLGCQTAVSLMREQSAGAMGSCLLYTSDAADE